MVQYSAKVVIFTGYLSFYTILSFSTSVSALFKDSSLVLVPLIIKTSYHDKSLLTATSKRTLTPFLVLLLLFIYPSS